MSDPLDRAGEKITGPQKWATAEVNVGLKVAKDLWTLLPWEALESVVRVMMIGAKKYRPRGWEDVPNVIEVYKNAAARHLSAMMRGEVWDAESNEPHAAHLACCALIVTWHQLRSRPSEPSKEP
jgi:hypothetical protein